MATERDNAPNSTAIIALTRNGAMMARTLAESLDRESTLLIDRRFREEGDTGETFDLPLRPVVEQAFAEFSSLIFFLSTGATIRLLAPLLESKQVDPAVVCVDDAGSFCVSLISGHVGGADRLAQEVASHLGSRAVITSASHASGTLAVDLLGREFGWKLMADSTAVTRASAAVINGQPIGIWQGAGERGWWPNETPLPENITVYPTLEDLAASACAAALIVTDNIEPLDTMLADKITVVYRPRSLAVGMGCRRGVPVEELESLLAEALEENDLAPGCLAAIATAELSRSLGVRAAPLACEVHRHLEAMPQYRLAHGKRVEDIERRSQQHPGLFIGGNGMRGLGMDSLVRDAELQADAVVRQLATSPRVHREASLNPGRVGSWSGQRVASTGDGSPTP